MGRFLQQIGATEVILAIDRPLNFQKSPNRFISQGIIPDYDHNDHFQVLTMLRGYFLGFCANMHIRFSADRCRIMLHNILQTTAGGYNSTSIFAPMRNNQPRFWTSSSLVQEILLSNSPAKTNLRSSMFQSCVFEVSNLFFLQPS